MQTVRTPNPFQRMLNMMRWEQVTNPEVVLTVTRLRRQAVIRVCFFRLDRLTHDSDLATMYEQRGLIPCDPRVLARVNKVNPGLVRQCPNATHWKDADGRWCYALFRIWEGKRYVCVDYHTRGCWQAGFWMAGVRKNRSVVRARSS